MAFNSIISHAAHIDLEIIVEYYYELNRSTARKYYKNIIDRIKRLCEFPGLGKIVPEFEDIFYNKYREIIYENFRIIYKIVDDTVVVVRIIDGRRLLEQEMVE